MYRAAGIAYTLPALSTCELGTKYRFKLVIALTGDCTVTRAGSDIIFGNVPTAEDAGGSSAGANTGSVVTFDQSGNDFLGDWIELEATPIGWCLSGGVTKYAAITLA